MNNTKLKLNKAVNFRTNEDLYDDFVIKCKLKKQRIGDRLNALISADLESSAPLDIVPEPVLFGTSETPAQTKEASGV